jgi:hypothetical protein
LRVDPESRKLLREIPGSRPLASPRNDGAIPRGYFNFASALSTAFPRVGLLNGRGRGELGRDAQS